MLLFLIYAKKAVAHKVLRGAALSLTPDGGKGTLLSYAALRTLAISYATSYAGIF